jgi:hypothetical protein
MSLVSLVSIAPAVPEKLLLLYQFLHTNQYGIVRIDIFNLLGTREAWENSSCELPYHVALRDEADKKKRKECSYWQPDIPRPSR